MFGVQTDHDGCRVESIHLNHQVLLPDSMLRLEEDVFFPRAGGHHGDGLSNLSGQEFPLGK